MRIASLRGLTTANTGTLFGALALTGLLCLTATGYFRGQLAAGPGEEIEVDMVRK